MFEIKWGAAGEIVLSGRFDASQVDKAQDFLDGVTGSRNLDFRELEYISSAGLGALLRAQKKLAPSGARLKIVNVNKHIHDVFRYAGFDKIFEIEVAP